MVESIKIGYQVFSEDGGEEFGAVRSISGTGARREIVVYVENAGDFVIPASAVKAVHDQKVILNLRAVDARLREAIAHAHDNER
jgi:ribosomal 30S subunit maturation factor RimM